MTEQGKTGLLKVIEELPEKIIHYPVELLLCITYFVFAECEIVENGIDEVFTNVDPTCLFLLFVPLFSISFTLNRSGLRWIYYASYFLWIVFLRMECPETGMIVAYVLSGIILLLPPQNQDNADYARTTTHLFRNIGLAFLIGGVLLGVLLAIYLSIVGLFELEIQYGDEWITSISAFVGIVAIPMLSVLFISEREVKQKATPALSLLLNYVLSPALIVYTVILYVYAIGIMVKWELPEGGVAYMVTAYMVIGLGCYATGCHLEKKPFCWYYSWFPAISLGPMTLLWIGTIRRIVDYGFTEIRVYLFALVVLMTVFLIMLLFDKTRSFKLMTMLVGIVAILLTYIPGITAKDLADRNQQHRQRTVIQGVDVSHHNGKIYWKSLVNNDKMQFVYIKATEGGTMVDDKYHKNLFEAKAAGLKVGAYHFLTTSSSAKKQFDNFNRIVKEKDIDLIPVLDAETFTKDYAMTKEQYVIHVRTWVDLCKAQYGKAPILYCSIGHYQKYFKGMFDECMYWTGDVNAKKSYVNTESWVIWQKTIRKCVGCSSKLDVNVLATGKTLKDIALRPNEIDPLIGIDVSHHNGKINWEKVKLTCPNLAFVYVKCTEGATYVDPEFKKNADGALTQGYNVGAYHYFRMTSSAHDQFRNFKNNLDAIEFNLIPMVDVEIDDGKPRKELQDSLQVLLNLMKEEYGIKPMIYGTNSSYNKYCAPEFNDYPMYIGRYGNEEPIVKGEGHYTVWQYSESGIIKGIPKSVDLCRFHPKALVNEIQVP